MDSGSPFRSAACRSCGSSAIADARCTRCGAAIGATADDPNLTAATAHLARYDALLATLPSDVEDRVGPLLAEVSPTLRAAIAELAALARLLPTGDALMTNARDCRLRRPTLEQEYLRLNALLAGDPWRTTIDEPALRRHQRWLASGGMSGTRLEVRRARLMGEHITGADMTAAVLEACDMTRVHLVQVKLDRAALSLCRFTGGRPRASFDGATVTDCDMSKTYLDGVSFDGARVTRTRFVGSAMRRTRWNEAVVVDSDFSDAKLIDAAFVRARFERCSFRNTTLAQGSSGTAAPVTRDAVFVECDFSGADFDDRDLTNVQFVRCKLAGVRASRARTIEGVVLEACDVEREAFARVAGPVPLPPPGQRACYLLEADMSSSDLRMGWSIDAVAYFDHVPTEAEARVELEKVALEKLRSVNGEDWADHTISNIVIKAR